MGDSARQRHTRAVCAALLTIGALSVGLLTAPSLAVAGEDGPFAPFLGSWRGSGQIATNDGQTEPINCRATYTGSDGGQSLDQSLVCASPSYRFDVRSHAVADGSDLQGQWQETTRNVQGDLSGRIADGDYEGTVDGFGFTARISIQSNKRRQRVAIMPSAGDIRSVQISLKRMR